MLLGSDSAIVFCVSSSRRGLTAESINIALQVEPSSELRKALQQASKIQKQRGDAFLGTLFAFIDAQLRAAMPAVL